MLLASAAAAYAPPAPGPVHVVSNQAELNAVFATYSDAELSNATIQIVAGAGAGGLWPAPLQLPSGGRTFSPRLTIRGMPGHKLPGMAFAQGLISGVDFVGLNIQHQAWPKTGACVTFQTVTNWTNCAFIGCDISHGYGTALAPCDVGAVYPEYARIDNVVDVGAAPQTVALTWRDLTLDLGAIQFFNRGSLDVEVRLGASASAAAAASPINCPAGARTPIGSADPTTAAYMHISCPTASVGQTVQCNARTEQGLQNYLSSAFSSAGGGSTTGDVEFRDCTFSDLVNAIKGLPPVRGHLKIFRNRFRRIYQDVMAFGFPFGPGSFITAALNDIDAQFSRAGLGEGRGGDAGDPHGDAFQLYNSSPPANAGSFVFVGNTVLIPPTLRAESGVGFQGGVYCDNTNGYADCYVVGNVLLLMDGGNNAISFKSASLGAQPDVANLYISGNVVFTGDYPNAGGGIISVSSDPAVRFPNSWVSGNICNTLTANAYPGTRSVGLLDNAVSRAALSALLADPAGIRSATTAADVRAKCAGVGAAAGLGVDYVASAIDRSATDASNVLLYEKLQPGVYFESTGGMTAGVTVISEIAKVLGGGSAMAITITGGQYQITADQAGTTVLQAWTSAAGAIGRGQFVQVKTTASAVSGGTAAVTLTIDRGPTNGGPVSTQVVYTTA